MMQKKERKLNSQNAAMVLWNTHCEELLKLLEQSEGKPCPMNRTFDKALNLPAGTAKYIIHALVKSGQITRNVSSSCKLRQLTVVRSGKQTAISNLTGQDNGPKLGKCVTPIHRQHDMGDIYSRMNLTEEEIRLWSPGDALPWRSAAW